MTALRRISAEARINYVWIAVSGLTILAWGLARMHRGDGITPSGPETFAVLGIASVKGRFIIQDYMEVRTAPRWLRRATDAWLLVMMVTVAVMYAYA